MTVGPDYVIKSSFGNDSCALIQWFSENLPLIDPGASVVVVYNDTGWSCPWWRERVRHLSQWVRSLGCGFHVTRSEGMEALVRRKRGWPGMGVGQFCTGELKIKPTLRWLPLWI